MIAEPKTVAAALNSEAWDQFQFNSPADDPLTRSILNVSAFPRHEPAARCCLLVRLGCSIVQRAARSASSWSGHLFRSTLWGWSRALRIKQIAMDRRFLVLATATLAFVSGFLVKQATSRDDVIKPRIIVEHPPISPNHEILLGGDELSFK